MVLYEKRSYAAPRYSSFRPYRAIVASADAWLSWGERIDGLTGGPIAEGVAVTLCPQVPNLLRRGERRGTAP